MVHLRYRLAGPIDDIALRHLAHVEKHVLAHFNVLAEGQIRHEQAAAGALGPLDGVALGVGVVPQGLCRLLKARKAQGFLQLGQLGLAVDIDQVILVPEPVDEHLFVLLTENEVGGGREWLPKGLASMERIDKILQAEVEIKDKENPEHISSFEHQIEFRHVSFAYTDHQNGELVYVLKDINLVIPKGKTIALVGQSGSGKSTMLDLIPRYYDVQEGEVLIDGINVKDLCVHDLRQLIGNVNQEAILFNASFKDNIRFGKTDATDEEIANAAKIANAYEFITKSEHGFDTGIGDRGGRLSGGQRQRVSIARAILKNPPILILDEATSALDTESERLVQDALEKLMKTRTTVAVAHRLSTIKHADEICVLHEGKIVERGTHEELIEKEGYYKKLHDMQQV